MGKKIFEGVVKQVGSWGVEGFLAVGNPDDDSISVDESPDCYLYDECLGKKVKVTVEVEE